ncbi:MAG: tRNA uridine-5-carboxymethylaminomethyl(34) synthesis GTPase MnmE, partial [Methanomicrobia archaeon]|nr:tRNA uridine-5-carboxymethylaminomethyl(34) synthesis GTPase MnmE [Methanomicrobia archaeon]
MLDTIVALATPPVKGALAIVRVSGQSAFETVNQLLNKPIEKDESRKISYRFITDGNRTIDEVIVLSYVGPKTFTGEDLVEIICHGSMLIVNEIIENLLKFGGRMATKGEFSSRAFLHGRIDLIQAEAINDLINATSVEAKNLSMLSLEGKTSKIVLPLKIQIADLLSLIEVNIDYPEYEDIEQVNKEKIIHDVDEIHERISQLIREGHQGKIIKDGIDVAIIGKPNVGKSSLLNALIKEDKAI